MKRELVVATCQFPVSRHIEKNRSYILTLVARAGKKGADIAHFSESSLSGYPGIDFMDMDAQDQTLLQRSLEQITDLAARLKIWVIVGGHHFDGIHEQPYNCLWLIDDNGVIVRRYDKRFCTGEPGVLEHYYFKPGKKAVQFEIKGVTCGVLICHEWRYPELYREQRRLGTEVLFQSWYDGNLSASEFEAAGQAMGSLIRGTVRGRAANNYLWISASNTSKRESSFASFVVQPDGGLVSQLKRNVTGVMITRIDLSREFEDPSGPWRARAAQGILHSDVLGA